MSRERDLFIAVYTGYGVRVSRELSMVPVTLARVDPRLVLVASTFLA